MIARCLKSELKAFVILNGHSQVHVYQEHAQRVQKRWQPKKKLQGVFSSIESIGNIIN